MRYPLKTKRAVVRRRKEGASIPQLSQEFQLSKSTVSLWVRDVVLSSRQKHELARHRIAGIARSQEARKIQRDSRLTEEKSSSLKTIQNIFQKNSSELWQFVAALLFWCEGGKNLNAGIQFANSDPKMVACFLHALREGFAINEERLRALIHLHGYHSKIQQTRFWSKITKIPMRRFQGPYMKPNTGRRKRRGYPGCISIRYYDKSLAQKLTTLYDAVGKII